MLTCRECDEPLVRTSETGDPQWVCPKCRARVLEISTLEMLVVGDLARVLRARIEQAPAQAGASCPACRRTMRQVELNIDALEIVIDVCRHCEFVQLDAGEFEQLPRRPRPADGDPTAARRALALAQVKLDMERDRRRRSLRHDLDDLSWPQRLLTWLGLPVDADAPESGRAVCTWTIAIALVVVFLIEQIDPQAFVDTLGWIPAQPFRLGGLTLFTSFFLHVGWLHLLGNSYFLIAFGRGVEGRIGGRRMLLLLLAAVVLGNVAHACFDPRSDIPCVGASGGLSALILFYAASFPWNRFAVVVWFGLPRTLNVPAVIWAGLWFLWQAGQAVIESYAGGSVSALSHVGGAIAGLGAFLLWRGREPPEAGA